MPRGYDALNDPPIAPETLQRWRANHPPCPECHREPWKGHWGWCSKAPASQRRVYIESQQRIDYRCSAREHGCVCPVSLAPHTHLTTCVLYQEPLHCVHCGDRILDNETRDDRYGVAHADCTADFERERIEDQEARRG